jgi:putative DNA primase/helicase
MTDQPAEFPELDCIETLSPLEFDKRRKRLAEELGVSLKALDAEYKERRAKKHDDEKSAPRDHWVVEPWPASVGGAILIERIVRRIKRHVVLSDQSALASGLWVAFAWAHDASVHSPILLVSSPEAECGKSTLLGIISLMVPRGFIFVECTPQVLYRMIERWHPTIILDEADSAFKNSHELRSIINSGWTRGAGVPRCHPDTHEPEFFDTFGPKAVGLKGLHVPDTTLSRSIVIEMERKWPDDRAEEFAHADDEELAEIRQQLARFAEDNARAFATRSPRLPEGFGNRLAANWRPLLVIAELCGPRMAERARAAAVALSRRSDDASLGVELLRDIRDIADELGKVGIDHIRSTELVNKLGNMSDRPWAEMAYTGKPISQPQLAKLLKAYHIKPRNIRFGGDIFKGYEFASFATAFRYIPSTQGETAATPLQSQGSAKNAATFPATEPAHVAAHVAAETAENSQCSGVAPVSECLKTQHTDNDQFESMKDPSRRLRRASS